jgi:FixJ family two-component response regulator
MISAFQNVRGDVEKAGANDFLAKPFDYFQLLGKVKKLVD